MNDSEFLNVLNHGTPDEQFAVGTRYEKGIGTERSTTRTAMLYIRAAENGSRRAEKVFFFDFNIKKKIKVNPTRFKVIETAAELGYAPAQYSLAGRYRRGIDVPKDYDLAFKWFTEAYEQGHIDAGFYLGAMYRKGRGTEKDDYKAGELIEEAARKGCAEAQHDMGKRCESGNGVPKDEEAAFKWYLKSAKNGYFMSYYHVAEMFRDGIGTEPSAEKAIEWFEMSASKGYKIAWFSIGQMYEHGTAGLKKDLEYYHIAQDRGYVAATFHFAEMYEKGIYYKKDMTRPLASTGRRLREDTILPRPGCSRSTPMAPSRRETTASSGCCASRLRSATAPSRWRLEQTDERGDSPAVMATLLTSRRLQ